MATLFPIFFSFSAVSNDISGKIYISQTCTNSTQSAESCADALIPSTLGPAGRNRVWLKHPDTNQVIYKYI